MADISLIQDDSLDDSDEGVYEQGDGPSGGQVDDDSLPPLLRIQRYEESENVFDRQMVPRLILELFRTAPAELLSKDLPQIMKIVADMADDDEIMVRTDLLEQIPNLATTALECASRVPELSNILSDNLLPIVVRNLGINDNQVRKTAHSTLFVLMEKNLVTRQQAEIQVCPTVLALSNMESIVVDYHTGAVMLMSKLAPFLGREVTERVFLQRFSQLCSNHMFHVRKVCASRFGDFCAVIGKDAYEHILLPCYIGLCTDDVWGVRKACAEVVISVSCACSPMKRRSALAPVFGRLLQDQSRWVRISAFQTLGPFISTFADPTITNLAYNNLGELVLVSNDGTEFRIAPTYTDTSLFRSVGELHMLYQFQERTKYDDEYNDDVIFNPLGLDIETESECKEIQIDNVALELEVSNTEETLAAPATDEIMDDITRTLKEFMSEWAASEKVGLEKLYVDKQNNLSSLDETANSDAVNEIQCKTCDNVDRMSNFSGNQDAPNDHSYVASNVSNCSNNCISSDPNSKQEESIMNNTDVINCIGEVENLEKFNSYNYWYVSPDMPLDPSIVDTSNSTCNEQKDDRKTDVDKQNNDVFSLTWDNTNHNLPKTEYQQYSKQQQQHFQQQISLAALAPTDQKQREEDAPQHIVPQLLIDHFVSMTNPNLAQSTDNEMAYHCAYSLPAVALTLGSKNWHLLKDTVEVLAANMQYKVRRTVASSLHELAMILGPDIATNNLTPIFEGFIKDLDEVRIGVLKHLAHFLRLISPSKRSIYLPRLAEFLQTDNEANWRFRQELAEQLLLAVQLFRPADATKHISSLSQDLLCDKVAAVREVALLLVTELIRHVSQDQSLTSRLLVKLAEKFAHSKRWKRRQSFALLCSEILTSKALLPEQFACEVMPHLLDLSWDPVANVRLVVGRTISQHIATNEYFADVSSQHYDGLQTVLRRLQSDKDRDVRQSAVYHKLTSIQ